MVAKNGQRFNRIYPAKQEAGASRGLHASPTAVQIIVRFGVSIVVIVGT